ncbi:hypothetical protein GC387_06615 [Pseudomonas sp. MWU12-2323]|nr:hypothetical protein [Pseudomonas sp. MWU12-2323]RBH59766.1 hypothetical protein C3F00_001425 [Pseudomonas sp. MWU13-2860]
MFSAIDNCREFREGVHTQIKRAYELSVCLIRRLQTESRLSRWRVCLAAWRSIDGNVSAVPSARVRRVLFSFHIVEIS